MDPDAVRRAGGRAVQLPAALHRLDERPGRGGAQRRRGPPRLVRLDGGRTPPTRAASTSACSAPASTTSPTRSPRSWSARPTSSRARARSASRSACPASGCSAWSTTSSSTAPSSSSARPAPPSCARWPTWPRPAPPARRRTRSQNALAAAALARAHGVSQAAVRDGLRGFRPDGHRIAAGRRARRRHLGRRLQGDQPARGARRRCSATTRWCGSPAGWPRVRRSTTWSATVAGRLRGAVLLGRDRDLIAAALARHAPDVPVIVVDTRETAVTEGDDASVEAHRCDASWPPRPGSPGPGTRCSSHRDAPRMDMFTDYAARGDAFAAAVQELTG